MKLVDILVQELPKRGGWPDGADFAVQNHRDGGIKFGKNPIEIAISEKWYNELWQGKWNFSNQYDFTCHEVSTDCREVIVLRGDYEAALAASKSEWNGVGLPPVGCECEYNTRVHEMKHVGGGIYKALDDPIIRNVRIVFVHGEQIAAIYTHNNTLITIDGSKYLRPIRSESDKKRDEATHAMASAPKPCGHDIYGICCEIYDAIAGGKIPGIRVE